MFWLNWNTFHRCCLAYYFVFLTNLQFFFLSENLHVVVPLKKNIIKLVFSIFTILFNRLNNYFFYQYQGFHLIILNFVHGFHVVNLLTFVYL